MGATKKTRGAELRIENLQVDVEMNSEAADAYGVTSLPTFIFFKQKKLLCRYEGLGSWGEYFWNTRAGHPREIKT